MLETAHFLCFQPEVCPTTGRPHYQCYIQFKNQVRHTAIAKLFNIPKGKTIQAYNSFVAFGSLEKVRF